jgi:hypothetical protein
MAARRVRPKTLEERVIFWSLVSAWVLYLAGALLPVYAALAFWLVGRGMLRRAGVIAADGGHIARQPIPLTIWTWVAGMLVMLIALFAGHIDYQLGLLATLKSSLGWLKGWALMALFPLAGAMLRIRAAVICRAACVLGLQTLLLTPLLLATVGIGLPEPLYVSPLHLIVGSEAVFFAVNGAVSDYGSVGFRLQFFAPWAPAAAFFASMTFMLALFERHPGWRTVGMLAAIMMCVFSLSRLSLIAIPTAALGVLLLSQMGRPFLLALAAPLLAIGIAYAEPMAQVAEEAEAAFTGARAESSRVRATLQRIALHRWQTEAPIFGHGAVERGPHLVEYMAIGSHHNWYGLLFVKGTVGFLACLVPLLFTLGEVLAKAQRDRVARCALGVVLVLVLFSFGENLETLAYLIWPGLLMLGIVARRRFRHPWWRHVRLANEAIARIRAPTVPQHP